MKIEIELDKEDLPRVKEFVDHIITFELTYHTGNELPDKSLLKFLNQVSQAIKKEKIRKNELP